MDIKDFQGIFGYKLFLPAFYILIWLLMLLGPPFFPTIYKKITIGILLFLVIKIIILGLVMIYINIKAHQIRNKKIRAQIENSRKKIGNEELIFGFIIPNYKEDVQMIAQSLELLASQRRAQDRYLVFLAMQAHEQGSQLKGYNLIERFKNKFRAIDFTRHEVRQYQQKGKASNVSWCAQHLQPIFEKNEINPQNVILTIMDADSWAPQMYIDQIEEYLTKNIKRKDQTIFQAPQIYTRNNLQVPVTNRVYDLVHSYAHCTQLFSLTSIGFPLSNYSLSYNFVKKFGFWDTCADAIGQDFHIIQKAYWKTGGKMYTHPIYVPFNQVNLKTEGTYWDDCKARFWQAQRHAQGVASLAYTLRMFFNTPFRLRNLAMVYNVAEACLLSSLIPWVALSMTFQSNLLYYIINPSSEISQDDSLSIILFNALTSISVFSYFFFEYFKRKSNTFIYKQKNESIFRILEYALLLTVVVIIIGIPAIVLGAFKVLKTHREYIVAQKKGTTTSAITQAKLTQVASI